MKAKELAVIQHDKNFAEELIGKCLKNIESCKSYEQTQFCLKYVKAAKEYLCEREHIKEYTRWKLFVLRYFIKDRSHEEFINWFETAFADLYKKAISKECDYI